MRILVATTHRLVVGGIDTYLRALLPLLSERGHEVALLTAYAGVEGRAESVVRGLQARVEAVAARAAGGSHRPRVVLLEWIDPPFSCGHWSPELVRLAGGVEGLGREGQR